jgi:hypothetical protein
LPPGAGAAKLLDRAQYGAERYLILQDGDTIFQAHLKEATGEDSLAGFENGSRVAVTGVCRIDPGEWWAGADWRAKSFRIQLRSAGRCRFAAGAPVVDVARVLWIAADARICDPGRVQPG